MKNDIRRGGMSNEVLGFWCVLGVVAGLLAFAWAMEHTPSSVAYNAAQCAVYGLQPDCQTPLR